MASFEPSAHVDDYLERILNARVYDVAIETPLDHAVNLSRRLHSQVFLKREDLQPVFSFKLRGAYNKMIRLPAEQLAKGVICASAGNHAQGVALSARDESEAFAQFLSRVGYDAVEETDSPAYQLFLG